MARKLHTFMTSVGFFDLAIAAPSMKAALEAWGTKTNIFRQGFAKEIDDPKIVAATKAKPGIVLRRAVGSNQPFKETAALPTKIPLGTKKTPTRRHAPKRTPSGALHNGAERTAALAFKREAERRNKMRRKEEAVLEKQRKQRTESIAATESALEEARLDHDKRIKRLDIERAAVETRELAENRRWERRKEKLERTLRRARDS